MFLLMSFAIVSKNDSKEFSESDILVEFTIAKNGDPILLPVRFKGEEHLFILDTGATHTIFDSSFKSELGSRTGIVKVGTLVHPVAMESYECPEAFLGPFNLQDYGEVGRHDFTMFNLVTGKKISGCIGMSFLKKHVIQIDFDNGKLYFLKPSNVQNTQWGKAFAIKYLDELPFIAVDIFDGMKVDFVVDTGYNGSGNLGTNVFRELASKKNLKISETLMATASGIHQLRNMRLENISMGSFNYKT